MHVNTDSESPMHAGDVTMDFNSTPSKLIATATDGIYTPPTLVQAIAEGICPQESTPYSVCFVSEVDIVFILFL